jgi:hypothetical protein
MTRTIHQLTSAGQPFPCYETMAENQARLDFMQDQVRYVPPVRDKRTPCCNPDCGTVCEGTYCSAACEAADNAVIERMAQRWEAGMLKANGNCQRMYYADKETGRVLLGLKGLADEQYAKDEAAGGLVALACGRR